MEQADTTRPRIARRRFDVREEADRSRRDPRTTIRRAGRPEIVTVESLPLRVVPADSTDPVPGEVDVP